MASLAFCLVENFFIASMLRRAPIVKPGTLICTFSDHTSCPTMQYTFSNSLQWVFLFWWGNVRNAAPLVPIFGVLTGAVKQCWGALKVDSSEYVGAVVPNLHVPALPPGPSASPWAQTPDPCCVCLMSLENSVLFFHKKLFAKARCGAKGSGLGKPGRFERRVGCCEFPSSGCSGCSQASCSHEAERLEAFHYRRCYEVFASYPNAISMGSLAPHPAEPSLQHLSLSRLAGHLAVRRLFLSSAEMHDRGWWRCRLIMNHLKKELYYEC